MIAEVIVEVLNSEVDKVFDYLIPKDEKRDITGFRVLVPFGRRNVEGFVVGIKDRTEFDQSKLKEISQIFGEQAILPEMIELASFMRRKYNLKMVDCLRLFIPAQMRGEGDRYKRTTEYVLAEDYLTKLEKIGKNAKKQLEIVNFLKEKGAISLKSGFSASSIKRLKELGIIEGKREIALRKPMEDVELLLSNSRKLTSEQELALKKIGESGTFLIHGVTGSGKTEVYMQIISREIKRGKSAIMLVPEISLTPQALSQFKSRFGETVAILHSGLSLGERYDEWNRLLCGQAKIALGARSAIFAPLKNIGAIIIDEEHDGSYISESNPRYNTFDIAKFRASYNNCSLILGSATPSIETYYKVEAGEINLIELPTRVNKRPLPKIEIVDMLGEIRAGNTTVFSRRLISKLEECFNNKKQAILFLNRRGYTSFMMCRECGYVAKCENCDVSLVYHKSEEKLVCHYCGKKYKALTACPECGSTHIRQGAVGTENVVMQFQKLFPNVPVFRMDNDTTRTKGAHQKILSSFGKAKPAVLVGTQMVAKGHDFEDVTLVGIIDADQGLYQSHYKSPERTFALITQVAGRAGRSQFEGSVVLQTYSPKKYVYSFAANYDYKGFYKREINLRKATKFPPFSTILRVMFSGENEALVKAQTKQCYDQILEIRKDYLQDFIYLDAMKSPISRIKQKFRYQILMRIKQENVENITQMVYNACDNARRREVLCFVEINPQSIS